MEEPQYISGSEYLLSYKEICYMIERISKEIDDLVKIKTNLILFSYSQSKMGKISFIDYKGIISEIQRIAVQIESLEQKRREYVIFKEV